MKEKTLLQKAMQIKTDRVDEKLTDEMYELGLAWAKGHIGFRQMISVMGYKNNNSVYVLLANSFKKYVLENEKNQQ